MEPSLQTPAKANPRDDVRVATLAVLQPGYLPWLGFFDQIARSDHFVIYDDVQFDKNGWRNRNRIKCPDGPHWLTVPVKVHLGQKILEVEIDNRQNWAKKHLGSIKQFYNKAPYKNLYLPELEELLARRWELLVDLDLAVIELFCKFLKLETPLYLASRLNVSGDRNSRLLNLCAHFNTGRYLSGNSAKEYLDVDMFNRSGIEVEWQNYFHPEYPQLYGQFVPYLSTLDLLLNCGPSSKEVIVNRTVIREL